MRIKETASAPTLAWQESGRFIRIGRHDIFVHERGVGTTILFIHGFPTSCFDWRDAIARLSKNYHCIALDLVGFGLSDKPAAWSYSLFQQADIVEELLSKIGVKHVHVVSHDMGTSLHTELLARKAEGSLSFQLESSTFLNGSIIKGMAVLTHAQKILENPATSDQAMELAANMVPGYAEGLKRIMGRPEALSQEDAIVMTELFAHDDGNIRIPNVYSYVRERYLHKDRWIGALQRETAPVQFVWGDADPIAHIGMGRALHELVPNARYHEAAGVGHFLPIEAPELVAERVSDFVSDISK